MKTIIAATDFSKAATNAVRYAAKMAQAIKGDLFILHTYDVSFSYGEMPVNIDIEEIQYNAEAQMAELEYEMGILTGHSLVITTEVKMARFYDKLESICNSLKPYAVVLGCQGTTAAERILFGSHATVVVKNLKWPVITVPPDIRFSQVRKIAIACDFDHVEEIPADEIKTLVQDFNAELHILNTGRIKGYQPELIHEASVLLGALAPVDIKFHFLMNTEVNEEILDFAGDRGIDLLIVMPKQPRFLERLTHSSPSKYFVLHSRVPVMALHS